MGGRHPRVPHAPPGSYRSPSRLLSKHIAACPLVQALKTPRWTLTTFKGEGVRFGSGRAFWSPFPGAAFALPHPDKPCSYQDDQGRGILRGGVPAHDFGEEEYGDRRTSPRHRYGERG